jgi:hypothetical protein
MRVSSTKFFLVTFVFVVAFFSLPAVAFAQSAPLSIPTTPVSTPVAVVMILSLLLGALTQDIQTGAFLGKFITPKSWLPGTTLAATFLGGVVGYFSGLNPVALTGSTIFYAVATGVAALIFGSTPGVAVHAHFTVPAQIKAARLLKASQAPAVSVVK